MYDEGVIHWETILTVLIGIVIVAFIVLLIYRKRSRKIKKQESDLFTSSNNLKYTLVKKSDRKDHSQ